MSDTDAQVPLPDLNAADVPATDDVADNEDEQASRIACSWSSAWVTEAPFSMAILVAVVSWPFNVPTMRSRMVISCSSVRSPGAPYP